MPAETRSRGAPPPSRVYHSTPALQQVQFPSRRRVVKTYGKVPRGRDATSPRQRTLTQLDFMSSFEEDAAISLSDTDEELGMASEGDKENRHPRGGDEEEEEDEPVQSGRKRRMGSEEPKAKNNGSKRRRTLGDNSSAMNKRRGEKSSRRRTMGDPPKSNYHTQTLTQFLGHDHDLIQDSEDEDDGFNDWLGEPASPSPRRDPSDFPSKTKKHADGSPATKTAGTTSAPPGSRQESVVPQTPAKRAARFEIPSSSQLSTPQTTMMARYGPVGAQPSPSALRTKRGSPDGASAALPELKELTGTPRPAVVAAETPSKKRVLVIQDSFAEDSWGTPSKNTPSRSPAARDFGEETPTKLGEESGADDAQSPTKTVSPKKAGSSTLLEIPDSDDDDDGDFQDEEAEDGEAEDGEAQDEEADAEFAAVGKETQLAMEELAPSTDRHVAQPSSTPPSSVRNHSSSTAPGTISAPTSLAMPSSPPPNTQAAAQQLPTKVLRRPIHHPRPPSSRLTQPFESQRVPVAALQALPQPSGRSDILLPVGAAALNAILSGREVQIAMPFRVPPQVVRFWLFEDGRLRFMACSGGVVERDGNTTGPWRYGLGQVYELNNPVAEEDMREEGWMDGEIMRYVYLPPAVVGQLLWNLRQAIFAEDSHDDGEAEEEEAAGQNAPEAAPTPSISVSQQVEAQLQSDIARSTQLVPTSDDVLVPSTPDEDEEQGEGDDGSSAGGRSPMQPPPARTPRPPTHTEPPTLPAHYTSIRPSQATTASQTSSPSQPSHHFPTPRTRLPAPPPIPSSSNLTFQEDDDDNGTSPVLALPHGGVQLGSSSQLLTRSQMLPESLVRDDARVPPEIWDSDDEEDAPL